VRRAERVGDGRLGVLGVEHVVVEVTADGDGVEIGLDAHKGVRQQLRLAQRVCLNWS
jgi:hypothetical protein